MVYNLRLGEMAESKGASFTKAVRKKAGRAKERLLQNFGKADRTTDEIFDVYVNVFNRQQNSAIKLEKSVKTYITCLRALQAATKNLMDGVQEAYDTKWPGHNVISQEQSKFDQAFDEICKKYNYRLVIPLSTYLSQFSEMRAKIDKRGRKLMDYDGTRHHLESLEKNAGKKDQVKLAKAREQMEEAKQLYDVLNKELHDELPALYDSRISFIILSILNLFEMEADFHEDCYKRYSSLRDLLSKVSEEAQDGSFHAIERNINVPALIGSKPENIARPYEDVNLTDKALEKSSTGYNPIVNKLPVLHHSNGDSVHSESMVKDHNNMEINKTVS